MVRERLKFMVAIKRKGGVVESFHDDSDRTHIGRGFPASIKSIHQQKTAEFLTTM